MDPLLITAAASGMKARMESLDMLANNIANSGTAGFKSDREFYNLYEQSLPHGRASIQTRIFPKGSCSLPAIL